MGIASYLIVTFFAFAVPRSAVAEEWSPQLLADRAEAQHPSLAAQRDQIRALRERARVAGAWPDPMVGFEVSNLPVSTFTLDDHPMSGLQFRVEQTLRPPGWSRLRREHSETLVQVASWGQDEHAVQLRAHVRTAWWELVRTRQLGTLMERQLERTRDVLELLRPRLSAGTGAQAALLRLELLRDQLDDALSDVATREAALLASLRSAVGEPLETLDTPTRTAPKALPRVDAPREHATVDRPAIQQKQAEEDAAQRQKQLARREALPDVRLWAGYRLRQFESPTDTGVDFVSIGLGVPIPVSRARTGRAARNAALAEASRSQNAREALLDEIAASWTAVSAEWSRAYAKALNHDERLIPAAQAILDAVRSDFTVGRAEVSDLLDAEVALIELERARVHAAIATHLLNVRAFALFGKDVS
ncbi:MAG: TolC family protein [Myxococcota bacterium]